MKIISEEELQALEKLAQEASGGKWCSDWCYSAIRHVQRNCDIECGTHSGTDDECNQFGRYDGPYIAAACPDTIKQLIHTIRVQQRALEMAIFDASHEFADHHVFPNNWTADAYMKHAVAELEKGAAK